MNRQIRRNKKADKAAKLIYDLIFKLDDEALYILFLEIKKDLIKRGVIND